MRSKPNFNRAWLPAVPATLAVWRARNAAKAALLPFCAGLLLWCAGLGFSFPAAAPAQDSQHVAMRVSANFAIADFDGDQRPDLATAEIERSDWHLTRYLIRLQLASGAGQSRQSIGVTGAFGLPRISAIDLNGDKALDLVITAAGQPQPIAVLLNDGRGKFSLAKPSDFPVAAWDSPWHWGLANLQFHDVAVLVPARTPTADAGTESSLCAPGQLAESRPPAGRGFPPDPPHSSPLGRAPPQQA